MTSMTQILEWMYVGEKADCLPGILIFTYSFTGPYPERCLLVLCYGASEHYFYVYFSFIVSLGLNTL